MANDDNTYAPKADVIALDPSLNLPKDLPSSQIDASKLLAVTGSTDGTAAQFTPTNLGPLLGGTQQQQTSDTGATGALQAGKGNRVNPVDLYTYLQGKFANSGLVGYVPPDGERWGIKKGSAAEWAAFGLAVAKQESDLNTTSYNAADPGGSAGLFQFGQGQTRFTKGGNQFDPQQSADAFVRSVQHYVGGNGRIADLGRTFGSIRRPNEAGQYIPYAQRIAAALSRPTTQIAQTTQAPPIQQLITAVGSTSPQLIDLSRYLQH